MSEKLLVPDIGDFENVEVIELLVKPGDTIKENDPIVTIESDKSSVEIPSTISGKIDTINVKVGLCFRYLYQEPPRNSGFLDFNQFCHMTT